MLIFALISSLGLAGNWEDFYGGGHKTCLSFCSGHGGSSPSYHRVHLDRSATAQAAPKISKSSNFSQTSNLVLRVFVLCLTAPLLTEFSPEKEKDRWSAMQKDGERKIRYNGNSFYLEEIEEQAVGIFPHWSQFICSQSTL